MIPSRKILARLMLSVGVEGHLGRSKSYCCCTARYQSTLVDQNKKIEREIKLGDWKALLDFNDKFSEKQDWRQELAQTMLIYPDFVTVEEESSIMKEIEPYISRLHYEDSHWDDAIHNYRETERSRWTVANQSVIDRVRSLAFPPQVSPLKLVHILDLAKQGVIKPHVDSVRFCGTTIAGISLLSSCVMRLTHDEDKEFCCDVLLPRLSLYVMKDFVRYKFSHEIMGDAESIFKGEHIARDRRISIICRNEPPQDSQPPILFTDVKPLSS